MMIVELKEEDESRIFIEAQKVIDTNNKVIVYRKDYREISQREEFTKKHYQHIKVKNHGGQDSYIGAKRDTNER